MPPILTDNILVSYGQEVYRRESCAKCHTLFKENESGKLVSLDGIGGKYLSEWHYYLLKDPQSVKPGSKNTIPSEIDGLFVCLISNLMKEYLDSVIMRINFKRNEAKEVGGFRRKQA